MSDRKGVAVAECSDGRTGAGIVNTCGDAGRVSAASTIVALFVGEAAVAAMLLSRVAAAVVSIPNALGFASALGERSIGILPYVSPPEQRPTNGVAQPKRVGRTQLRWLARRYTTSGRTDERVWDTW